MHEAGLSLLQCLLKYVSISLLALGGRAIICRMGKICRLSGEYMELSLKQCQCNRGFKVVNRKGCICRLFGCFLW